MRILAAAVAFSVLASAAHAAPQCRKPLEPFVPYNLETMPKAEQERIQRSVAAYLEATQIYLGCLETAHSEGKARAKQIATQWNDAADRLNRSRQLSALGQ